MTSLTLPTGETLHVKELVGHECELFLVWRRDCPVSELHRDWRVGLALQSPLLSANVTF